MNVPAFPTSNWQKTVPMSSGYNEGMTLRDYFAAKAMQGMITRRMLSDEDDAKIAYKMADAMLKERNK